VVANAAAAAAVGEAAVLEEAAGAILVCPLLSRLESGALLRFFEGLMAIAVVVGSGTT
jgi:hypothetical protein